MRGDLDEPNNHITDDLYELCDFEDLMLTGDQRRGRRLSQSYEIQLSQSPSPTKLDGSSDGRARRRPATAAGKPSARSPVDNGGKQRRESARPASAGADPVYARRRAPRVDSGGPDDGLVYNAFCINFTQLSLLASTSALSP